MAVTKVSAETPIANDNVTARISEMRRGEHPMTIKQIARHFHKRDTWVTGHMNPEDHKFVRPNPIITDEVQAAIILCSLSGMSYARTSFRLNLGRTAIYKYWSINGLTEACPSQPVISKEKRD